MIQDETVVCISAIDWDFVWQGQQEIATRLAAAGNEVVFVENLGVRPPRPSDAARIMRRLRNWLRGRGALRMATGVLVQSPILLPFPYDRLARRLNRRLLRLTLLPRMPRRKDRGPIVWVFLPTPTAIDLAEMLRPDVLVYHCVDDLARSSAAARPVAASEADLIGRADLVFATSVALQAHCAAYRPDVHRFPMAVDTDRFDQRRAAAEPADLSTIRRPRIVYIGGVHRWIDYALVGGIAQRLRDARFVFIGPLQERSGHAADLGPNVFLLGQRDHADLPSYLAWCDAAIIPYRRADYTDSVYPSKLNEYLAMGLPVVGTRLPELVEHDRLWPGTIRLATGPDDFASALRAVLGERDPAAVERRMAAAHANSWGERLGQMSTLVEEAAAYRRKTP